MDIAHRSRPLKVGVVLAPFENRTDQAPGWTTLVAAARQAEAIGVDSLWIPDHLLFRHPDQEPAGAWEAWSLLAALAAATTRVELGTFVLSATWRNPALLAKMAATVDEISGGRLVLGLGAGWHAPEFAAFGYPYNHRYARFAEALEIIHGLLRQGHVDVEGTYYAARDCELRPRGPRPQGPPIMIGTTGDKMLRLTARYADWWNIDWRNQPADLPPYQAAVDAACAAVDRDPATLVRTAGVMVDLPGSPARAVRASPPLGGTAEAIADGLRGHARAGIAHAMVWLNTMDEAGIAAFAPVLDTLDRG
jgi:alkanesulfonate monooxygenase SsuD/methylene tetrahydromethanopterin reductase-like flavin-dependent oxidoreductase (luciferase family)